MRLRQAGVHRGDRFGLSFDNGREFVFFLHALGRIGAVASPLDARVAPEINRERLSLIGARGVLSDSSQWESTVRGAERTDLDAGVQLHVASAAAHEENHPGSSEVQTILFTSGTTATGKAVELTHANHWWNAFGSMMNLGSEPVDIWLDCLPLHHTGGLSILLRSVLYGVPVVLQSGFDPERVNHTLDREGVTLISVVSTMLLRMLEQRGHRPYPPSLRGILLGGGPIPQGLEQECFELGIPIAPTYGLTESASQVATLRPRELSEHRGSAGRPLMSVEVRVEPLENSAQGSNLGEILLRGPSIGRYATEDPDRWVDGWLRTGDLGSLDDGGYLRVYDRREDLIITGGENVSPAEVESVLLKHPALDDAAVFATGDPEWGQSVTAAVITSGPVSPDELDSFCRRELAPFKRPRRFLFVEAIPRTGSGKVRRGELRKRYETDDES